MKNLICLIEEEAIMLYLFMFLLAGKCQGISVPLAKVMEDGYWKPGYQPFKQEINVPNEWTGKDMSVCFWIFPFRYSSSAAVFTLSPATSGKALASFSLKEGQLVLKLSECLFAPKKKTPIREWTHFCFSLSEFSEVYVDGIPDYSYNCNNVRVIDYRINTTLIKIGNGKEALTPFSGDLADIRIYWRSLSEIEMKNISLVLESPDDYDVVPDKKEQISYGISVSQKSLVTISSVTKEELLAVPSEYMIIYIPEVANYKHANRVCKNMGGSLPDLTIHDQEMISKQIHEFIWRVGVSIEWFWVTSSQLFCQAGLYYAGIASVFINFCEDPLKSFICFANPKNPLKMIGFMDKVVNFYPVPFRIGIFESETTFRLYFQNGKAYIKNVIQNQVVYYALVRKTNEIIGRNTFYEENDNKHSREITLTSCLDDEFTCSNGACIPIQWACNFHVDCHDKSDEKKYCDIGVQPSKFYDDRLSPSSFTGNKTKLGVYFSSISMVRVDIENDNIVMRTSIELNWTDPRLTFKFLLPDQALRVDEKMADYYWKPDIIIKEAINGHHHKLSFKGNTQNMTARALKNGTVTYVQSYEAIVFTGNNVSLRSQTSTTFSFMCDIDLFDFPFDQQICSLTLEIANDYASDVIWDDLGEQIPVGEVLPPALFTIERLDFQKVQPVQIQMTLSISRNYGAYIFNSFLPCVVLEAIGLITHFLPTDDYTDRVSVTLSCLIVMATLFTQVSSTLPKSAEPKLIDVWMFVHIAVLLLIFVVHVIVIYIDDKNKKKKKKYLTEDEETTTTEEKTEIVTKWTDNNLALDQSMVILVTSLKSNYSCSLPPKQAWILEDVKAVKSVPKTAANLANNIGFIFCLFTYCIFLALFYLSVARYFD